MADVRRPRPTTLTIVIQAFLIDHPPAAKTPFTEHFTWPPGGWVEPPTKPDGASR